MREENSIDLDGPDGPGGAKAGPSVRVNVGVSPPGAPCGSERLRVCMSNAPDEETACRVARALVEEGLAACVNVLAPCRSIYRWQGAVEEAVEWPLIIKTTSACWAVLVERLRVLHPHEVPEIVELAIGDVDEAYAHWAAAVTRLA